MKFECQLYCHPKSKGEFYTPYSIDHVFDKHHLKEKRFDKHLTILATEKWKIMLNTTFKDPIINDKMKDVEIHGKKLDIRSRVVIAADGIQSKIAKKASLKTVCPYPQSEIFNVDVNKKIIKPH